MGYVFSERNIFRADHELAAGIKGHVAGAAKCPAQT